MKRVCYNNSRSANIWIIEKRILTLDKLFIEKHNKDIEESNIKISIIS